MLDGMVKYAPSIFFFILEVALQVSGYTNVYLAYGLVILAFSFLLWPLISWIDSNSTSELIPLLTLRDMAEKKGWDFNGMPKLNFQEFVQQLRQAGLNGSLTFFGKPKKFDSASLNMNEPLHHIKSDHWGSHSITGLIHTSPEYIGTEENKYVESYVLEALSIKSSGFVDLHVRKKEGVSWLKKVTKQYKKK